jgi:hypothetical protein
VSSNPASRGPKVSKYAATIFSHLKGKPNHRSPRKTKNNQMATLSPNSSTALSSSEEAEQLIRYICHHGFRTSDEMQQAIDSHLLPYADQILALPKTTYFTDKPPFGTVYVWALARKCYPLLRYLIHNGWEINRAPVGRTGCPSLLGYAPFVLIYMYLLYYLLRFFEIHSANICTANSPSYEI